jgi:hypothetical protein
MFVRQKRIYSSAFALVVLLAFAARGHAENKNADHLDLDASKFGERSATIDNKWWPMKPGVRLTYDGFSKVAGQEARHSVVTTFTDLVKDIQGVQVAVMLEEDYHENQLQEREIAFHAQDKEGNVWHLGQLRENYDRELIGGRVFIPGHPTGAKPGIRMWGNPREGLAASQGFAPAPFNWTDRGAIHQMGQQTKVPSGSYSDVLITKEWDEETAEGVFQTKHYAPGLGIVRMSFLGPDPEEEEQDLVKIEQLDEKQLAKVRDIVLGIEARAYIYGHTSPAYRKTK